jgi:hypothetical protein
MLPVLEVMNDVIAAAGVPGHSRQIGVDIVHVRSIDQLDTTAYEIDFEQRTRLDAENDFLSASSYPGQTHICIQGTQL